MPDINYLSILVAAIVPNALGALYYGPLFGKHWLKSFGMTADDMKGRNEALIYGLSFLMSFISAFFINFFIKMGHKDVSQTGELIFASHQTFGHGFFHGMMICMGLIVPVIVSLGLFHKATLKNVLLNIGFWILSYGIMGGILDVWK